MTNEAVDRTGVAAAGAKSEAGEAGVAAAPLVRDILIVDDDPIFRYTLQRMLSQGSGANYRFAVAEHARQAIDLIELQAPDLVISDIFMPVADGFELLNWMRFNAPRIPALILSVADEADPNFNPLQIARSLGASDVLTKPFDREALIAAIDRALEGAAARAH